MRSTKVWSAPPFSKDRGSVIQSTTKAWCPWSDLLCLILFHLLAPDIIRLVTKDRHAEGTVCSFLKKKGNHQLVIFPICGDGRGKPMPLGLIQQQWNWDVWLGVLVTAWFVQTQISDHKLKFICWCYNSLINYFLWILRGKRKFICQCYKQNTNASVT